MHPPGDEDHDLDALFGNNETIDVPDPESTAVEDLDAFASADLVDLADVELNAPTEPIDPHATLPPSAEATAGTHGPGVEPSEVGGLPPELACHPRYRILRLLGKGGMGVVFQAEHRLMHRLVALKLIHQHFTASEEAAERFRREVRTAARLHHPHIVSAYDAEQAGSSHFLVMEYVEGRNLGDYLREKGPLPIDEACGYIHQAALGLQYAHAKGMVHRDIKPDNLMRTDEGQIKILDFGLARFAHGHGANEPGPSQGGVVEAGGGPLTLAGAIMGTPDYMAPEQASNSSGVDIRGDIYSLGCSLYQLLTGEVPFPGGTVVEKVIRHAGDPAPPLTARRPDAPAALCAVVEKMMAKDPTGRYLTPAELAEALRPNALALSAPVLPAEGARRAEALPGKWPASPVLVLVLVGLLLLALLAALFRP